MRYTQQGYGDSTPEDDDAIKQCDWCLAHMDIDCDDDLCSDQCAIELQEYKAKKKPPRITQGGLVLTAINNQQSTSVIHTR